MPITKFTNCRLLKQTTLIDDPNQTLWVDSATGKILNGQHAFYEHHLCPDETVDLGGRILAPGFIEAQLNGAFGFDFSVPAASKRDYEEGLRGVKKGLVREGVTGFLPTVVSSRDEVYWEILPSLAPSGSIGDHRAEDGAESLGAHLEGPFINPQNNGIHKKDILRVPNTLSDIIHCYGEHNLNLYSNSRSPVKMITVAPELGTMLQSITHLTSPASPSSNSNNNYNNNNIILSIGHSDATYEQGLEALSHGASMITHLFNAMRPFYHRNPGLFGLLAHQSPHLPKPYYGVIADGIHLHPTSIRIAYNAHPTGLILVTDAMRLCGLPDGVYDWTNGERIQKSGSRLTLVGSGKIAGSSASLVECVNNFWHWSGASLAQAVAAVTATPARLLGLEGVKGCLEDGADADLVVLGEYQDGGVVRVRVEQVWKFGVKVFDWSEGWSS